MKHRKSRRLRRVGGWLIALLTGVGVVVLPFVWPAGQDEGAVPARLVDASASPAVGPTGRARPMYLTRSYRAPPSLVRSGAGGRLEIPSLRIEAPVDAVGLDDNAMAVPNDVARVGWLTSSARPGDLAGASIVAGHVSDQEDRPGALSRLHQVRVGAQVVWTDVRAHRYRFRVVRLQLFRRDHGLPASMFRTDGPHVLYLVTCAERTTTTGGGFHYQSNLVVTAVR